MQDTYNVAYATYLFESGNILLGSSPVAPDVYAYKLRSTIFLSRLKRGIVVINMIQVWNPGEDRWFELAQIDHMTSVDNLRFTDWMTPEEFQLFYVHQM